MEDFNKQIQQTQANADVLGSTIEKLYQKLGDLKKQQADMAQAGQAGTQYFQTVTSLIDKYKAKIDDVSVSLTSFNVILGQQERVFKAAQDRAEFWGKAYDGAKGKIEGVAKAADGMGKILGQAANGFKPLAENLRTATQVTDFFKTGIAKANRAYTDYAERVASGTGKFQAFKDTMGALTQGIGGGVGSLKSFKLALAETGIGLIIIAVAALIEKLQEYRPIMDKVTAVTAACGAVMNNLANLIMHPIDNFKNLGASMASAAKDAYNLSQAQTKLKDSLSAQEVANESLKAQVDLLKQQTANTKLSTKEREVALAKIQKMEAGNYKDNKDLATKARDYAIEDARIKGTLHTNELAQLKEKGTQYAKVLLANGSIDQKQFEAIKKADLDLIKLRTEYNSSTNELLQNRENLERDAAEKIKARQEAAAENRRKANEKHADQIKKMNDFIEHADEEVLQSNVRQIQSALTGYALEVDITTRHYDSLIKTYQNFIDDYNKLGEKDPRKKTQLKQFEAATNAEQTLTKEKSQALAGLMARFQQEDLAKLEQYQKELEKIGKNARQQAEQQLEDDYNKQKADIDKIIQKNTLIKNNDSSSQQQKNNAANAISNAKKLNDQLKTRHDLNKQMLKDSYDEAELENKTQGTINKGQANGNQIAAVQGEMELLKQQHDYKLAHENLTQQEIFKINQEYATKKAALEEQLTTARIHAGDKFINAVLQNSKKDSAIFKAAFMAKKAVSIADVIISTKKSIIASFEGYSGMPFIGQALAIAQGAFIAAQGAASIATIAKQQPGFAQGGHFVSDGRGAVLPGYSRADNTNAFLRSGEAVVVSEAMRNPWARNLVSAINVAHGGRDFSVPNPGRGYAIGGIFTDGGNASRYYSQPANDVKDLANTLAYQLVNNFPPIYVDVKDVNNQQNILAQTVNRVNL